MSLLFSEEIPHVYAMPYHVCDTEQGGMTVLHITVTQFWTEGVKYIVERRPDLSCEKCIMGMNPEGMSQ